MNSVRSNNISLKYQRFTTLGSKDKGIIKSEFVTKTQFLYHILQVFLDIDLLYFVFICVTISLVFVSFEIIFNSLR